MLYVLLGFLALIGVGLFIAGKPYVAAWWYEHFRDTEVYPPEAAQAPPSLGEHFSTAPIDDLDTSIDWHRYEYEMRKQT
jgi:hypothetical protein